MYKDQKNLKKLRIIQRCEYIRAVNSTMHNLIIIINIFNNNYEQLFSLLKFKIKQKKQCPFNKFYNYVCMNPIPRNVWIYVIFLYNLLVHT